jgi:hypothetical protein
MSQENEEGGEQQPGPATINLQLICQTIAAISPGKHVSRRAISEYILDVNFGNKPPHAFKSRIRAALNRALEAGVITQKGQSFKVMTAKKEKPKPAAEQKKKPRARKPAEKSGSDAPAVAGLEDSTSMKTTADGAKQYYFPSGANVKVYPSGIHARLAWET